MRREHLFGLANGKMAELLADGYHFDYRDCHVNGRDCEALVLTRDGEKALFFPWHEDRTAEGKPSSMEIRMMRHRPKGGVVERWQLECILESPEAEDPEWRSQPAYLASVGGEEYGVWWTLDEAEAVEARSKRLARLDARYDGNYGHPPFGEEVEVTPGILKAIRKFKGFKRAKADEVRLWHARCLGQGYVVARTTPQRGVKYMHLVPWRSPAAATAVEVRDDLRSGRVYRWHIGC